MLLRMRNMLLALAAIFALAMASNFLPNPLDEIKECTSIDIRNECNKMNLLDNCTVVIGYVMITLIPSNSKCNFSSYQFPKLREITDFLIFTEVRNLVNIRDMFPNLTVIRGRRLFLNYAVGITSMPDLQLLEFKSLVAIQHGHVYIGNCHKLCQLNKINWDRLTLSAGENHNVIGTNNCTNLAVCQGCKSNYCWSNFTCQRFENDNVAHYDRNSQHCHEECLGGCYNATAAGCVVCRGLTNAGVCVKRCPAGKYLLEQYQRCYSREECVIYHGHYTSNTDCVAFCPSGFKANAQSDCVRCGPEEACISVCSPDQADGMIAIYNLADAEELRGCQIVNSSLIITIRNQVNELQLERSLGSIREIRGHLKIFRSSQLSSLKFLSNLRRIHGDPLENRNYALILYDNKQLSELWEPSVQLEFVTGGMFMHRNNKLCNKHMIDFQTSVIHDKMMDSLQANDQEVLCGPAKLQLTIQTFSHRTLVLSWPKAQTSVELELIYRTVPSGKLYVEPNELQAPICTRIKWQRLLLFVDELQENGTHYSFRLEQLEPHTRYACLLRTFGGAVQQEARSDLIYVQTLLDIPKSPMLVVIKKTDTTLTLRLGGQKLDHYILNVHELLDDAAYIDERDYCRQPAYPWQYMDVTRWRSMQDFKYDDCCAHQAEVDDDQHFHAEINELYRCSLDASSNCADTEQNQTLKRQLPPNTTLYELRQLERYRMYSLQLQACNALGCSSATLLTERTNFTLNADLLPELSACRVPKTMEYIMRFAEPAQPNGLIVNYVLHYRNTQTTETKLSCITRRAHAEANYVHISSFNSSYNECAVRVHSLAGDVMTSYVPISSCNQEQSKLRGKLKEQHNIIDAVSVTEQQDTQLHGHGHGISIFVICFLFGCAVSLIWLIYKRRCWRKWPGLRRYVPVREQWLHERQQSEDREILVDGFETVRFQNSNSNNNNNNHSNNHDNY